MDQTTATLLVGFLGVVVALLVVIMLHHHRADTPDGGDSALKEAEWTLQQFRSLIQQYQLEHATMKAQLSDLKSQAETSQRTIDYLEELLSLALEHIKMLGTAVPQELEQWRKGRMTRRGMILQGGGDHRDLERIIEIRRLIAFHFTNEEMKNDLVIPMNLEAEVVTSGTRVEAATDLVQVCVRRGRVEQLIQLCGSARPMAPWPIV